MHDQPQDQSNEEEQDVGFTPDLKIETPKSVYQKLQEQGVFFSGDVAVALFDVRDDGIAIYRPIAHLQKELFTLRNILDDIMEREDAKSRAVQEDNSGADTEGTEDGQSSSSAVDVIDGVSGEQIELPEAVGERSSTGPSSDGNADS